MKVGIVMCTISHRDEKQLLHMGVYLQCVCVCVSRVRTVVDQLPSHKAPGAMCCAFCGKCVCVCGRKWEGSGGFSRVFCSIIRGNL